MGWGGAREGARERERRDRSSNTATGTKQRQGGAVPGVHTWLGGDVPDARALRRQRPLLSIASVTLNSIR
eukprot:3385859-Rhodomonas_salina.1